MLGVWTPNKVSMQSLQCNLCYETFAMQSLQCNLCNATFAMQSLRCNLSGVTGDHSRAIVSVLSLRCNLCCAIVAMQSLSCNLFGAIFAMPVIGDARPSLLCNLYNLMRIVGNAIFVLHISLYKLCNICLRFVAISLMQTAN